MRDSKGRFIDGIPSENRCEVGSVKVRTRHKRNGEKRAFIKIGEPNTWILLAKFVWEKEHGPIPRGFVVHHKDRNKLNDSAENLKLITKAEHLAEHRSEFAERMAQSFTEARHRIRWTTKSKTGKIVGRHPRNCVCPIHS